MSIDLCSALRHSGTTPAVDSERLANDRDLQATFAVAVQNRFAALADPFDDVEQSWRDVRDNLVDVARTVIGPQKRPYKLWLSSEADKIIALKRAPVDRGDNAERNRLKRNRFLLATKLRLYMTLIVPISASCSMRLRHGRRPRWT